MAAQSQIDAIELVCDVSRRRLEVVGPDGVPVMGEFIVQDGAAWVESASACGLELTQFQGPELRSTVGVGELINAALDSGVEEVVLGCGGSSTIDMGLGMLEALGATVRLDRPRARMGALCLADLPGLVSIDLTEVIKRLEGVRLTAAVDAKV